MRHRMAEPPSIEGLGPLSIRDLLGAAEAISVQQLAIYIPDRDKNGAVLEDHTVWVDEALRILSDIGGGASAIEKLLGAWLNPETGILIRETTCLVYTYIVPEKFVEHIPELRAFLHEFGVSANQVEVMMHF